MAYLDLVDDFHAVGDGVTDDSVAVLAALDYCGCRGLTLHVPGKTFLISQAFTFKPGFRITGNGSRSVFKLKDSSTIAVGASLFIPTPTGAFTSGTVLENFTIDGNKANNASLSIDGVKIPAGLSNVLMSNVEVKNMKAAASNGNGLVVATTLDNLTFMNCRFNSNEGKGVSHTDGDDAIYFGCEAISNGSDGINISGASRVEIYGGMYHSNAADNIAFGLNTTDCTLVGPVATTAGDVAVDSVSAVNDASVDTIQASAITYASLDDPGGKITFGIASTAVTQPRGDSSTLIATTEFVTRGLSYINVLDYGATGDGVTDDTTAIQAAIAAAVATLTMRLYYPAGTYRVSDRLAAGAAGFIQFGDGPWETTILVDAGFSDTSTAGATYPAVFGRPNYASSSALMEWRDLKVDLNGVNVLAFDFGQIDSSIVRHCAVYGGTSLGTATGTGARFHSPLSSSSYCNVIEDTRFRYLTLGVDVLSGGNLETIRGGSIVECTTAASVASTRNYFDGVRVEGNTNGITENGTASVYTAVRFEDNTNHDFTFGVSSVRPMILGPYHAGTSSSIWYLNLSNATDPIILGPTVANRLVVQSALQDDYTGAVLRNTKHNASVASRTRLALEYQMSTGVQRGGVSLKEAAVNSSTGEMVFSVPVSGTETDIATVASNYNSLKGRSIRSETQTNVTADGTAITATDRVHALHGQGANRLNCTLVAGTAGQFLTLVGYTWDVQVIDSTTAILAGGSANFGGGSGDVMSMELMYSSHVGKWIELSRILRP